MKEKNIGKYTICFIIVCLLMIIMTSILSYFNKDKLSVNTLNGNIKDIGKVSLVYTPNINKFSYEEVIVSKNGIKNDTSPKSRIGNDYLNIDKKYSDFINNKGYEFVYKDDLNIGEAYTYIKPTLGQENNNLNDCIKISNKNLKNGVEESFDISLKQSDFKKNSWQTVFNKIYKGNLYMVVSETNLSGSKVNNICILKIDIKDKSYKLLNRFDLNLHNDYKQSIHEIKFSIGSKIYLEMVSNKSTNGDIEGHDNYSNLIIYDIEDDTFNISNKFMDNLNQEKNANSKEIGLLSKTKLDYIVKNNKLNLIATDRSNFVINLVYDINSNDIKLEDYEILDFKVDYSDTSSGIRKVKLLDDKIYSISSIKDTLSGGRKGSKEVFDVIGTKPVKFQVFDKKLKKTLYEAELINGDVNIHDKLFFVAN
ncbi:MULTISPECIES: hypothetical protein [Clostridioides]|uniref:hypothetical protein n=1 Tax=Clostridioides sp. ZZV14-6387 TaxID=2811497 RepID=UPI0007BBB1AB|nr:hypothetical protein [Clostridioides sp. ZZV14-6387]MCI9975748.1 hypothetical protein [Clostridioides difficile]MDI7814717.1 hypothetical protein [Clostridioides difficile]NJI81609.1 hypothetical protein [Clostridioides difficile]CZR96997.1 hypothetical protein CDFC105_61789 [Clostridioides difficile]